MSAVVVVPGTVESAAVLAGLTLVSLGVAAAVAAVHRFYLRNQVPTALAALVALAVVALYLNVRSALGDVVAGASDPLALEAVLFNGGTVLAAALVVPLGVRLGDRLGRFTQAAGGAVAEGDLGRIVRSAGRVITVELPTDIETPSGYEAVPETVERAVAGETFVFPRGLTVGELTERIRDRVREDHEVGYVDVEVDRDGTVRYLALGGRPAGLGPTLGPGTAAVGVRGDPAAGAGPGDTVQLVPGPDEPPVARGEVRGVAGDVVTVAVDDHDAREIAGGEYRLVTLPDSPRPEHEFGRLLRAADETLGAVTVGEGSGLAGLPVGAIGPTVVAVRAADGTLTAVPSRRHVLAAGETCYVVATPSVVRRAEAAAGVPERT